MKIIGDLVFKIQAIRTDVDRRTRLQKTLPPEMRPERWRRNGHWLAEVQAADAAGAGMIQQLDQTIQQMSDELESRQAEQGAVQAKLSLENRSWILISSTLRQKRSRSLCGQTESWQRRSWQLSPRTEESGRDASAEPSLRF